MRKIELLAPAKSAEIGIEAINHGADAVYIGAPQFGARASAGNSVQEIERLARHAHLYGAQVYVALNTLLNDDELVVAERIAHELYHAGADALIVQDMGVLQLDLPPIALHASTQTDNRTPEKVAFLEKMGFTQVVLARELSLQQIREIAQHTSVALEAFIHGALCVSYSGQCYISHYLSGRSANRGACAQYCRLPYTLEDSLGKRLARNQHLLSLKDLNLTPYLEQMLDAGVSSLKIEGRLKEMSYVKNVTAHYRKQLDRILSRRECYGAASVGACSYTFEPDPTQSFNRGFTPFFIEGERSKQPIISPHTPKSIGTPIGVVKQIAGKGVVVEGDIPLNNGDGVTFHNTKGEFEGFRVNRVEGQTLFPATPLNIKVGTALYRNYNHAFETLLSRPSANRQMGVEITLSDTPTGYALTLVDESGVRVTTQCEATKEQAKSAQAENQVRQLSKLGGTPYRANRVVRQVEGEPFIPSSLLNQLRQDGVQQLTQQRIDNYQSPKRGTPQPEATYPLTQLTYLGNVMNSRAKAVYSQHGVSGAIAPAFEQQLPQERVPLMYSKHCLRHHLGACPKMGGKRHWQEPLFLTHKELRLELVFDCKACQMLVYSAQ